MHGPVLVALCTLESPVVVTSSQTQDLVPKYGRKVQTQDLVPTSYWATVTYHS